MEQSAEDKQLILIIRFFVFPLLASPCILFFFLKITWTFIKNETGDTA